MYSLMGNSLSARSQKAVVHMPQSKSLNQFEYSQQDEAAINEFHRATARLGWHTLGTCAMKAREQKVIVDDTATRLNVYGVKSIAPLNVGAYNTVLIIGEKAALIIAEDLGIEGV
ncbi:hypothetical protein B0H10DRAFT_1939160 [Mycena sp. CBHHK59/15]|nr:hypothetical protein B0H10DRAFT_1939160 [Mycena sp. CBHHK59/15]